MITIVKRGERIDPLYAGACRRCNTEITYHERDLETKQPDRPGVAPARYVDCPLCECNGRIYHTGTLAKVQP